MKTRLLLTYSLAAYLPDLALTTDGLPTIEPLAADELETIDSLLGHVRELKKIGLMILPYPI